MAEGKHSVVFIPNGRGKAKCQPNPSYPNGIVINQGCPEPCCLVKLTPYPTPELGLLLVECETCGLKVAITAAGRPDDPTAVYLPCRIGLTES